MGRKSAEANEVIVLKMFQEEVNMFLKVILKR